MVEDMLANKEQGNGFLLHLTNDNMNKLYRSLVFASSDNTGKNL